MERDLFCSTLSGFVGVVDLDAAVDEAGDFDALGDRFAVELRAGEDGGVGSK